MNITVQYSAQARHAVGRAAEQRTLARPTTVQAMLQELATTHGEALQRLVLTATGEPQPALLVFVNDEQVPTNSTRELRAGDTLTLLPPISGG